LVGAQRGAVCTAQLQEIGFTEAQISHRVATGIWHRQHHGVYCVGDPALIPLAAESAALLAVGEGSLLSHGSAGAIWGLCQRPADQVSVTLTGRRARGRHGISLRCLDTLERADMSTRQGLALTAPGRTIIDMSAGAGIGELAVMLEVAWERRLVTEETLLAAAERAPTNDPGRARVQAVLSAGRDSGFTRSHGERRLRSLLKAAELPQPVANHHVAGLLVDFYWPEAGLVLEVDGFRFHGSRAAFERDRRRDQRLAAAGIQVIRITWRQLEEEPMAVLARLAQALARRAA
jgi:very-short-patch-repair endonuclease